MDPLSRQTKIRLLLLLAAGLLVSYGLLKVLLLSAHGSLPRFRPESMSPVGEAPLYDAHTLFTEDFETFQDRLWRHFIRHRKTTYELFHGEGGTSLKAVSRASASGLIRELRFQAREYPILSWRWKVEHPVEGGDLITKRGSDAAARIYVIFEGKGPLSMERLLNYVWAWNLPKEGILPSHFSPNSRILVVESGQEGAGEWRTERRNLLEDYRKVFHEDPGAVKAIALMTDSDNTGSEATAYYDDLRIGRTEEGNSRR